jgi:N-acetylmuramoyl-L-alanine amidase
MLPIRHLTIHCAATREGQNVTAAQLNAVAAQRFGPGSKSYHWIVLLDGTKVRNIPDDRKGIHVAGANTGNIGIVYVGGVATDGKTPKDTRTPAQKVALRELVAEYQAKYPGIVVRGHRDWPGVNKACPSFNALAEYGGAPATPASPRLLKRGDTGEDVKALQRKLNLPADGSFGPATEAAVKAFQTSKGLTADGVVGDKTRGALGL